MSVGRVKKSSRLLRFNNNNYIVLHGFQLPKALVQEHHCDLCDRSFRKEYELEKHVKEHITCKIDGCQFTAHPKIIANHVRMQHTTGIFNKIKKLGDPIEINKWIAERKRLV